jgi:dGTP triphosphohydrolase
MLILEIQRIKANFEESYSHLLSHFEIFEGEQYRLFMTYLLNNSHMPRLQRENAKNFITREIVKIERVKTADQKMSELVKILLNMRVPDFNKLYYNAIHRFKIKEEFLYLAINRRLQFVLAYLEHWSEEFHI